MEKFEVNGDSELEFADKLEEQYHARHHGLGRRSKFCQDILSIDQENRQALSFDRQSHATLFEESILRNAKRKSEEHLLMKSLRKCKIQRLTKTFITKLKQGAVLSHPQQLDHLQQNTTFLERALGDLEGIDSTSVWNTFVQVFSFLAIVELMIIYSLSCVFGELEHSDTFIISRKLALCILILQTITNFFVKNFEDGKMIVELTHIIRNYLRQDFKTDLLELILLTLDVGMQNDIVKFCRLILVLKIPFLMDQLDRIKNWVCTNAFRENQWGVLMVIITNFVIAHFVSVLLNSMAFLDSDENWWVTHKLANQPWYVRYIYGFYWATNIMLTVGFGDFAATNWLQALALTFIEMLSCITLAYNINCVGNLLGSLRAQQLEKNKNLRTFSMMYDESKCDNRNLENRIKHYIVKTFEMKTNFNIESQQETLSLLPEKLRQEFVKQANEQLFENLQFLKEMSNKTLNSIALKLQKKLTHPQEIIIKKGEKSKLHILQSGEICYVTSQCKRGKYEQIEVQKIQATDRHYKQVSLRQFIRKQEQKHNLVSGNYSVIYTLDYQDFDDIVRQTKGDFQRFCMLRDQDNLDFLIEALDCNICESHRHSKFDCPRLHYVPLKEIVCLKYRFKCDKGEKRRHLPRSKLRFGSSHPNVFFKRYANLRENSTDLAQIRSHEFDTKNELMTATQDNSIPYCKYDTYFSEGLVELDKMHVWRCYFPRFNMVWHD